MRLPKCLTPVFILVVIFTAITGKAVAQGYYFYDNGYYESALLVEAGFTAGGINGMTDVGGSKKGRANAGAVRDFTFKETNFTGGLYTNLTYKDAIAFRIEFNVGRIEAADSNLKGTTDKYAMGRYVRNLSFRSNTFEIGLGMELHPLMMFQYLEREPPRLSPYMAGGVSWLRFDPMAELNGVWYNLEPLRLEGQGFSEYPDRKRYNTNTFGLTYGLGLRYEVSQMITLRFEVIKHSLFTDYLDDVSQENWVDPALFYKYLSPNQAAVASQLYNRSTVINPPRNTRPRGKSKENDAYWSTVLKIGFNLNRIRSSLGSVSRNDGQRRATIFCPNRF